MGKWAQYQKRGTARASGPLGAPSGADWSVGTPAVPATPINRIAAIPSGADAWSPQSQLASGGAIISNGAIASGTPLNVGTPVAATAYRVRIAWFRGTLQVSDWSDWKPCTTP